MDIKPRSHKERRKKSYKWKEVLTFYFSSGESSGFGNFIALRFGVRDEGVPYNLLRLAERLGVPAFLAFDLLPRLVFERPLAPSFSSSSVNPSNYKLI